MQIVGDVRSGIFGDVAFSAHGEEVLITPTQLHSSRRRLTPSGNSMLMPLREASILDAEPGPGIN